MLKNHSSKSSTLRIRAKVRPAPYVSEQGYICVRYAQAEETEDWMSGTGSVNKPALVFEGRVAE